MYYENHNNYIPPNSFVTADDSYKNVVWFLYIFVLNKKDDAFLFYFF